MGIFIVKTEFSRTIHKKSVKTELNILTILQFCDIVMRLLRVQLYKKGAFNGFWV